MGDEVYRSLTLGLVGGTTATHAVTAPALLQLEARRERVRAAAASPATTAASAPTTVTAAASVTVASSDGSSGGEVDATALPRPLGESGTGSGSGSGSMSEGSGTGRMGDGVSLSPFHAPSPAAAPRASPSEEDDGGVTEGSEGESSSGKARGDGLGDSDGDDTWAADSWGFSVVYGAGCSDPRDAGLLRSTPRTRGLKGEVPCAAPVPRRVPSAPTVLLAGGRVPAGGSGGGDSGSRSSSDSSDDDESAGGGGAISTISDLRQLITASLSLTDSVLLALEAHAAESRAALEVARAAAAGAGRSSSSGRAGSRGSNGSAGSGGPRGTPTTPPPAGEVDVTVVSSPTLASPPEALHPRGAVAPAMMRPNPVPPGTIAGGGAAAVGRLFFTPAADQARCYGGSAPAIRLPGVPASRALVYRGAGHWSNTVRYNSLVVLQQLDRAVKDRLAGMEAAGVGGACVGGVALPGVRVRTLVAHVFARRQHEHSRIQARIASGWEPGRAIRHVQAASKRRHLRRQAARRVLAAAAAAAASPPTALSIIAAVSVGAAGGGSPAHRTSGAAGHLMDAAPGSPQQLVAEGASRLSQRGPGFVAATRAPAPFVGRPAGDSAGTGRAYAPPTSSPPTLPRAVPGLRS